MQEGAGELADGRRLGIAEELHDLNSDNKIFLQSRLLPDEGLRAALDTATRKVESMLSYTRMIRGGLSRF
jgi:hypothetical protein